MSDPVDTTNPGSDGIPQHAAPEEPGSGVTPELTYVDPAIMGTPSQPAETPSREPVLDAARIGGLVAALIVAIGGTVTLVLAGRWTDITALGTALGGVISAALALSAYLAPVWQARKARAKVTPLIDPRDAAGRKLIPSEET